VTNKTEQRTRRAMKENPLSVRSKESRFWSSVM
jgi:hypothetical protein